MFLFPMFTHSHALGLDIQSDQITLLYLKKSKKKWQIASIETEDVPLGVIIDGKVTDSALLMDKLKTTIERSGAHGQAVAIALPGNCVLRRDITFPQLAREEEYAAEMDLHIDTYLPGVTGDLRYDYQLQHNDGTHQRACLVAARSEIVDEYVRVVQQSGLDVSVVDVDCYALARAMHFYAKNEHHVFGWIDVGCEWIRVFIFNQANLVFEQQIARLSAANDVMLSETICHFVQRSIVALNTSSLMPEQFYLTGKVTNLDSLSQQLMGLLAVNVEIPDFLKLFSIPATVKQEHFRSALLRSLTSIGLVIRMYL